MPREYYTLEENPAYTEEIEKLYNSDPVLAESGVFYNLLLRIMNNIRAVKKEADELEKAVEKVSALEEKLTDLEKTIGSLTIDDSGNLKMTIYP